MSWSGRRVLVTGAGGFIGSHLAERLVREGAVVRAFVRYNAPGRSGWLEHSPLRREMEVVAGDIRDRDGVSQAVAGRETIFHLAALIGIPYSYQAPGSYLHTNVEGTLHVLQAARQSGAARIVHTSTSEVYGSARYAPIDEAHPLQAQSPYAASKIGADKMAEAFHRSFGTPVVTVRPFNTFGPRQSARAIIPALMAQALAGDELRAGNLTPTRDMTFVADTVEGFLRAGEAPAAIGQVINLGSGREISIGALAALIGKLAGRNARLVTDSRRVRPEGSEVERLLADNTRAREWLGWSPQVTLEEGLRVTMDWIRNNADAYRPGVYEV